MDFDSERSFYDNSKQMRTFLDRYGYLGQKAFTLVELAIVLVILGFLIGLGAGVVGILTKKVKYAESKEEVKRAVESLKGYAIRFGYLPPSRPPSQYNAQIPDPAFNQTGVRGYDSQNRALLYVVASELTSGELCSLNSTSLSINDKGNSKSNLAFFVVAAGLNFNIQTDRTIYPQGQPGVDDFAYDFTRPEEYDDIVEFASLFELQHQRCNYASGAYCNNLTIYLDNAINSYAIDGTCRTGSWLVLQSSQKLEAYIAAHCNNLCGEFVFPQLITSDSNKNCQVEIIRQGNTCIPRDR